MMKRTHGHGGGGRVTCVAICLVCTAATPVQQPVQQGGDKVEGARTAIEKYVETKRILSKEKRDWALGKEMLTERMAVVRREIESLRAKIADADRSIADADKKRADLAERNKALDAAVEDLRAALGPLETRTKELLARLPESVGERASVRLLSQRLPEKPEETKATTGERFMNIAGILNELNKANREVAVASEVRALDDKTTTQVTALYVGLGQGYYCNGAATIAGFGGCGTGAWTWTAANDAAAAVAAAIAILKNERVAAFVALPVRIQ
jgi:septal ring factor EnvC (AmiA/AmiB activator)